MVVYWLTHICKYAHVPSSMQTCLQVCTHAFKYAHVPSSMHTRLQVCTHNNVTTPWNVQRLVPMLSVGYLACELIVCCGELCMLVVLCTVLGRCRPAFGAHVGYWVWGRVEAGGLAGRSGSAYQSREINSGQDSKVYDTTCNCLYGNAALLTEHWWEQYSKLDSSVV